MNKLRITTLALTLIAALAAAPALAADTATLTVTATVDAACSFDTDGTMAFGAIDPTDGVDAMANSLITYTCTLGVTPIVGAIATSVNLTGVLGGTLPVDIAYTDTVVGNTGTLAFTGTILDTVAITKAADSYTGTLNLTINP